MATTQVARVSRLLVDRIRSGEFGVGRRLPGERLLAVEFGVSRPVVREAISSVSALGLLDVQVGRGAFVTASADQPGTVPSLLDVVDVREVLEVGALELAARRGAPGTAVREALSALEAAVQRRAASAQLDRALHLEIVRAGGSPLLLSTWCDLASRIEETIRVSPHGEVMSAQILQLHRELAGDDLGSAVAASRALHEQNREFLRAVVG